ncbi:MAG TPA: hypothetical protein VFH31_18340 [Pyrinomonadaceae bacterium]|nr:hypothetical protein [Pyrinomonadaceae bacterium]
MSKNLPLVIASGLGEVFGDEKKSEVRRDAAILFFGICLLLLAVAGFITYISSRNFFAQVASFVAAFIAGYLIDMGGKGILRYKRSLTGIGRQEVDADEGDLTVLKLGASAPASTSTQKVSEPSTKRSLRGSPPPSITESTTKRLDSGDTGQVR